MTEHVPSADPTFDPDDLGFVLCATPIPRLHSAHGAGYRYALGPDAEEPQADLEVYPDARLVRFTDEGIQLTFRAADMGATYTQEGVVFDIATATKHCTLTISRFGEALLVSTLLPPLPQEVPSPQPDDPPAPARAEPPTPQPPPPEPNDPSLKGDKEKQPRVVLTGTAAADPHLARTRTGTPIAKFPLAVTAEEETTHHAIVAFNGLATEVAQTVKKGLPYKVVGYHHHRTERGETITEVYAATVKPPSRKQHPPTG